MENTNVKNPVQECLVCDPYPRGVACKGTPKREEELNKRIKIVEKGGLKMKDILAPKKPFKKSNCKKKTCPLCTKSEFVDTHSDEVKILCSTNNA